MPTCSIIIPTLNEEKALPEVLEHLQQLQPEPFEVLVVDGGSTDQTEAVARQFGVRFITCPEPGRGPQLNYGVAQAQGELLVFLHADTLVPLDLVNHVTDTLRDSAVVLGGFQSVMQGPNGTRWWTTNHNRFKTYYGAFLCNPYRCLFHGLRLLVGDQVMFCRKEELEQVGGFPNDFILEDLGVCKRLNRLGRVVQLREKVYSSDRRVGVWGELRANLIYGSIGLLWILGVPARKLARFYRDIR